MQANHGIHFSWFIDSCENTVSPPRDTTPTYINTHGMKILNNQYVWRLESCPFFQKLKETNTVSKMFKSRKSTYLRKNHRVCLSLK